MAEFTLHTAESNPEGSMGRVQATKGKYGLLSSLFAVQSESPAMLVGYMALAQILSKTKLSETEYQIILMTNNRLNGCNFCMAAHTSIAQAAKAPAGVIAPLRSYPRGGR